ncbi:S8 family serine peptidase [Lysobacter sp. BMK333-48F3]|uniref:S8 family serine peptidase n=1 Tax=Lysobacter sp. BMK333-48F3 TaxID=2867962 RepID=UPI001C8CA41E|nr:S8 family serine peptidase [Lysobacter sp. BMK333-48F3]MBX9403522.1 S8 family serine peptidase [Lysobacter sp. BMK333-48F3]
MTSSFRIALLCGAVLTALGASSAAIAGGRPDLVLAGLKAGQAHRAGEVLVKFRDGSSASQQGAARQAFGLDKLKTLRGGNARNGELALWRVAPGRDLAATVYELSKNPSVEYAEPNWEYQHQATSNDTYYTNGSLWGMYGSGTSPANAYGSQAAQAWAGGHTDCSNVVIGIIDEGYMYSHPDLAANAWTNPYDPADGVDNDGNGYVDDVHGWDFEGGNNEVFDGAGDDHGTHVAGTIAGAGGNGQGVAGVCWSGVKLISGKFLGRRGGSTADAITAIDYFNDLKSRHGLNIVATNNSWGGGGFSQALQDAIGRANTAGILFVVAAGNSGVNCDTSDCYPAEYPNPNVLAVTALRSNGTQIYSYGATTIDIGAPGYGIWSTVPVSSKGKVIPGYASYNGTSMATPHVTGAVALYASSHPGASAADIKSAVMSAAIATPSLSGKTVSGGRLNASGF